MKYEKAVKINIENIMTTKKTKFNKNVKSSKTVNFVTLVIYSYIVSLYSSLVRVVFNLEWQSTVNKKGNDSHNSFKMFFMCRRSIIFFFILLIKNFCIIIVMILINNSSNKSSFLVGQWNIIIIKRTESVFTEVVYWTVLNSMIRSNL